jgi:hypothetical protein
MVGLFDDATDPYTQPQQQPDPSSLLGWLHSMLGNAGQQQQAEAGASQAMQPAVTGYLGDVASGQMAARAIPQDHYDPSRSFAQNALDPQALEQAQNIAMGFSGGGLGIRAYHGSPHDFDAFDASKIGTGEGAQAYGHGLYFAESEPVARSYRDALASNDYSLSDGSGKIPDWAGNQIKQYPPGHQYYNSVIDGLQDLFKGRIAEQDTQWPNQPWMAEDNKRGLQSILDSLGRLRSGDATLAPRGRMYEVDINADPQSFLHWDKPLSEQSPQTQQGLGLSPQSVRNNDLTGKTYYTGLGDKVGAATFLKNQGIPGIRYLDQGSRGGAGQGTSNYVVFDPKIIDILRKYAVPGLIAGGAAAGATSPGNNP